MKFKRFTKPSFLKQIGRGLLTRFFDRFSADLAEKSVVLPSQDLPDDDYFEAVAKMALAPEGLPDSLNEAIFGVEAMANDNGQERLERAAERAGLDLTFDAESSHADVAVQVWLADPELFARQHNEQRLTVVSTFESHGAKSPVDRRQTFGMPDAATLTRMTADMDAWFRQHNRGHENTHIEVYSMEGDFWFPIRHGATFTRMPTDIGNRRVRVIHFRPTKDDIVVYSPERDEIRIHAATKGERELYRETFGTRLFGDPRFFSERKAFDLEPLRMDGVDALDVDGISGISEIILREIEWAWDNGHREVVIRKADDIFAAAAERNPDRNPIPEGARLVRAAFDVYFGDNPKPRKVQIRPPNVLKLGRHCDAKCVHEWLTKREFRVNVNATAAAGGDTDVQSVARP